MLRIFAGWKRIAGLALLFAGLQLVPVDRSNPPVDFELPAPAPIQEILERSCYDCHSNETEWPWYAYVAPASWKVAYDVGEARSELNFSSWRSYRPDKRTHMLEEILEEVEEGNMPPWYYELFHPGARLTDADHEALKSWVGGADG